MSIVIKDIDLAFLQEKLPKPSFWQRVLKRLGILKTDPESEWKKVDDLMAQSAIVAEQRPGEENVWQLKR
jgi:hypothetical protein